MAAINPEGKKSILIRDFFVAEKKSFVNIFRNKSERESGFEDLYLCDYFENWKTLNWCLSN